MMELLEDLNYLIMRKIRKINYLKLDENEIQKICKDINDFLSNNENETIGKEECEKIRKWMFEISEAQIFQES